MSLLAATQVTAVATAVLAFFAVVAAVFAGLAFRKQSTEVTTLQRQAQDQSEQLGLQRTQFDEQRKINEKQTGVLELQAQELRESLGERKREAEERRQGQAAKIAAWLAHAEASDPVLAAMVGWGAYVRNASDLPVFDVKVCFHYVSEEPDHSSWAPHLLGGPVDKIRVIPPQDDRFAGMPKEVQDVAQPRLDDSNCVVSIEFTDAAGNKWERDPRGALLPLS
jgi:hypothetical protein